MIYNMHKITAEHLQRRVYIYVRQSTMVQVRRNLQSQDRQYGLVGLVVELGWNRDQIEVVDEDLGLTGTESSNRSGFQRMVTDVGLGKVGIIMALEASRLARNNSEWYRLMDLCAVCGTLIADGQGVYDPQQMEDRFYLGLKGSLSEMELHTLRNRLVAGALNKAKRGDLVTRVAVGYVRDGDEIRKDPGAEVRSALEAMFQKFEELGSAGAVWRWLIREDRQIPSQDRKTGEFQWARPARGAVHRILKHPIYTGAYVYGRKQVRAQVKEGTVDKRLVRVPSEQWHVLVRDHHEGYISWAQYEENQKRLRENQTVKRESDPLGGSVREGAALLQGIVCCGRCGRRMYTVYGRGGGTYSCQSVALQHGGPRCQRVPQREADECVRDVFLEAIAPAELEISLQTVRELEAQAQQESGYWRARAERATYEAQRTYRQYNMVEPENRTVARELERRWEEKLRAVRELEDEAQRAGAQPLPKVNARTAQELRALASNLRAVWEASTTTAEDRKLLVREMIQQVWLTRDRDRREAEVKVIWTSHHQTTRKIGIALRGQNARRASGEVLDRIGAWAPQHSDAEIAHRLNEAGLRSGWGRPFTHRTVSALRLRLKIPAGCPMAAKGAVVRGDGRMTLKAAAEKLGVKSGMLWRWARRGLLDAIRHTPRGQWWVRLQASGEAALRARAAQACRPVRRGNGHAQPATRRITGGRP